MPDRDAQLGLEALLFEALRAEDPAEILRAAPEEWRERLTFVDLDGLRIAGLLVARLRFERLVQASRRAADWFERDAAGFTAEFRRYHRSVTPTARDPWAEAAEFEAWIES